MPSAYDSSARQATPIGGTIPWPSTSIPPGFLRCDGASLSRAVYAELFAAIGEKHGTLNSTVFNIPDYRGRSLRGVDGGVGRDPDRASRTVMATGGAAGDDVGSVQLDALQNITGTITNVRYSNAAGSTASGAFTLAGGSSSNAGGGGQDRPTGNYTFNASNVARTSTETRIKNAGTHFIIRYA